MFQNPVIHIHLLGIRLYRIFALLESRLQTCFAITYVIYRKMSSQHIMLLYFLLFIRGEAASAALPAVSEFISVSYFQLSQPSMEMYFFSSTAGFASFFGTVSFRVPSSNFALISSWVTSSPT